VKTIATVCLALFGMLAFCERGYGLVVEHFGPDKSAVAQPAWPKGIVELVRHPSRVYSRGNGSENFYFQAGPDEINELLDLFSKARMRDHEIRLEPGTNTVKAFRGGVYEYNVSLHVLGGIALAMMQGRNTNTEESLEPVLTIYTGEDRSLLKQLRLPENANLRSEIEGVKGKLTRPRRKAWYGRVQWEDSAPAVVWEHGLSTRISLWEEGLEDRIQLVTLGNDGFFATVFSDAEMAGLKGGRSWLTVTVGNWLTQAKKDDPKYPAEFLALEQENAKPLKLRRPGFYYGRVLFEDGSPPVLDPKPWPGAEVSIDFPYAGPAHFDSQGYFQLFFGPEQFAELKSRKPSKNIYLPTQEQGSSVAMDTFPAELLSQDRAKAGVVRIPKPVFKPVFDPAKAPSLIGKPLPALGGLRLSPVPGALSNGMILVCFFDLEERPSRHCITQLVKQAEDLKAKGLFVAAVQASTVDPSTLEGFVKTEKIPFPVGKIEAEEEKTRFNWGLKSLPWLILTDREHFVRAEGFPPGELSDKLAASAARRK
jgi:hypothetical protein